MATCLACDLHRALEAWRKTAGTDYRENDEIVFETLIDMVAIEIIRRSGRIAEMRDALQSATFSTLRRIVKDRKEDTTPHHFGGAHGNVTPVGIR